MTDEPSRPKRSGRLAAAAAAAGRFAKGQHAKRAAVNAALNAVAKVLVGLATAGVLGGAAVVAADEDVRDGLFHNEPPGTEAVDLGPVETRLSDLEAVADGLLVDTADLAALVADVADAIPDPTDPVDVEARAKVDRLRATVARDAEALAAGTAALRGDLAALRTASDADRLEVAARLDTLRETLTESRAVADAAQAAAADALYETSTNRDLIAGVSSDLSDAIARLDDADATLADEVATLRVDVDAVASEVDTLTGYVSDLNVLIPRATLIVAAGFNSPGSESGSIQFDSRAPTANRVITTVASVSANEPCTVEVVLRENDFPLATFDHPGGGEATYMQVVGGNQTIGLWHVDVTATPTEGFCMAETVVTFLTVGGTP